MLIINFNLYRSNKINKNKSTIKNSFHKKTKEDTQRTKKSNTIFASILYFRVFLFPFFLLYIGIQVYASPTAKGKQSE